MTRIKYAAVAATLAMAACSPPEITSRLDSSDALYSGFETAESYVPTPVGARAENDFMRFSTMGVAH